MNLTLDENVGKLINDRVKSGQYASAEDVVVAALHSLDNDETFGDFAPGELDALLAEGEASGPPLDGTAVLEELSGLRYKSREEVLALRNKCEAEILAFRKSTAK